MSIEYKGICRDGRTYGPADPWMQFEDFSAARKFAESEGLLVIEQWQDRARVLVASILFRVCE